MTQILHINRKWLIRIADGPPAIDWGAGLAQALDTRKFFWYTGEQTRAQLSDQDLQGLVDQGQLLAYDRRSVSFNAV